MRWVIFWSSLWLLGCWGVVGLTVGWLGLGARIMALITAAAVLLVWPVGRLCWLNLPQDHHLTTTRMRPVLEAVALVVLVQFVLWPLGLLGNWPPVANLGVSALLLGWALFAASLLRLAQHRGGMTRSGLALLLCVVILGLPILPAFTQVDAAQALARDSALLATWNLMVPLSHWSSDAARLAWGFALVGWLIVVLAGLASWVGKRRSSLGAG